MDCNKIEIELRRLLAQVENWRQQQKVTTIDKGLAMTRLQSLYAEVIDIVTVDPPLVIDEPEIKEEGDVVEFALTEPPALWDTTTFEIEDESIDPKSEHESVGEQESLSEDTVADDTTHESQDEMVIDIQKKCEHDCLEDDESEPTDGDIQIDSESTESSTENADEHQDGDAEQEKAESENQEHAQVVKDVSPRVFGIKVNAYARQEMIDTLFRGNVDLFDAECDKIDTMEDLEQALIYIGENYRWIPDNMTTIRFVDLMETHFANRL